MKPTPTPRTRFLAVIALIVVAGAAAYLLMHGSGGSSSASTTTGTQTTTQTHTTTTTQGTNPEKKGHKKSAEGIVALDAALIAHPIVVVSVYARNVSTDTEAMKEAKAGAAEVGAGFVAFNVFKEKLARQLTSLLGDSSKAVSYTH